MNVVLLRVGIDTGSGGISGPLFPDRSFEVVPIPDGLVPGRPVNASSRNYGNTLGHFGRPFIEYFPTGRHARMFNEPMHVDPEFEAFTYGDPTPPKRGLKRMGPGDLLVFYAGLEGWGFASPPALYIVGYFEVVRVGFAPSFSAAEIEELFAANAHVRVPETFVDQYDRLLLIKGGPGSRLLTRAVLISDVGTDRAGRPLKIVSPETRRIFGAFGGKESIQRSPPRWVAPDFIDSASSFVRSLA